MTNDKTAHRNFVPTYSVTAEVLKQIFARSDEQLAGVAAARKRAQEWPRSVEETLLTIVREVAALRARVDAVEQAQGTGRD
jgi:hypothetical protein